MFDNGELKFWKLHILKPAGKRHYGSIKWVNYFFKVIIINVAIWFNGSMITNSYDDGMCKTPIDTGLYLKSM